MNATRSPEPVDDSHDLVESLASSLRQINQNEHPSRQRLELLELQAPAVNGLIPGLYLRIVDLSFPLSTRSERVAQCIISLQAELFIGYNKVAESEAQKPASMRTARQAIWILACHRALYYFSELIRTLLLLNRDVPLDYWQSVHQLYLQTRERGLLQAEQGWDGRKEKQYTLEHAYKRVILRALMRPERLPPSQQQEACRAFNEWVECVQLCSTWSGQLEGNYYFVDLLSDNPPYTLPNHSFDRAQAGSELLIDTSALAQRLHSYLDQCQKGHQRAITRSHGIISVETLQRLHRSWCVPQIRSDARKSTAGRVEFAIGLEQALQHWFDSPQQFKSGDCAPLWRAEVLDRSHSGLRLQASHDLLRLRTSDLIILPEARTHMTTVFEVRWLRERQEGLQFGIRRLYSHTFPIQLELRTSKTEEPELIAALAGVDSIGRPLLLLPDRSDLLECTLAIRTGDRLHPIRLRRRLSSYHSHTSYHFYRHQQQGYAKEIGLSSSQLMSALS